MDLYQISLFGNIMLSINIAKEKHGDSLKKKTTFSACDVLLSKYLLVQQEAQQRMRKAKCFSETTA